eukprot:m.58308 g.58308  ORF g.58308 m.58308 type:complete len:201 (+) comp11679_c0_seq3:134-736(+)
MPKKKSTKKGAKKGTKKKDAGGALTGDEKVKKAQLEVKLLQSEVAERRDEARRAVHRVSALSEGMLTQRQEMDYQHRATQDITSDLTRQYKLMQSQLMQRIMELQEQSRVLQDRLEVTQRTLSDTREQAEKSMREKNDLIAQLTQRIQSMESAYESVLNVCLTCHVCAWIRIFPLPFTQVQPTRTNLTQSMVIAACAACV